MRLIFLLFMLGCFGTAHAGWFGPKNYDECILENMKGVTLKQAVWAIQNSCRAKFPEACYAWQKKQAAKPKGKPWERYADQRNQYRPGANPGSVAKPEYKYGPTKPLFSDEELAEFDAPASAAPDGCYAVLDR